MPIDKERFQFIRERYGHFASWAVWPIQGERPKSNMEDLSIFEPPHLGATLAVIHTKYVLVALNVSITSERPRPFTNFHGRHGEVYKARFALAGTPLWGSYMTDILKNFSEPDSSKVRKRLSEDPSQIMSHLDFFRQEVALVAKERPVLVAFGKDVHSILQAHLSREFSIPKIDHYAARMPKEEYRERVRRQIRDFAVDDV